ncbi:MAG: DUF881 domain-containing protein [Fimbriimonadaceae bacterium]
MNPFATRISGQQWVVPVSALSLVLGFMMTMAWVTQDTRSERIRALDPSQQQRIMGGSIDLIEEYRVLSEEVERLRAAKTQLENAMGNRNKETQVLNDSLQETKLFAALTEVEGPGITVTLRDNERAKAGGMATMDDVIHDTDVVQVVNELWAAGAEAISVNGLRVSPRTSFRCVGPTILVDNQKISSPVRIRAIGDVETLIGAMNMPGGALAMLRESDPNMVSVEKVERHRLPAFAGSTANRFMKNAEATP